MMRTRIISAAARREADSEGSSASGYADEEGDSDKSEEPDNSDADPPNDPEDSAVAALKAEVEKLRLQKHLAEVEVEAMRVVARSDKDAGTVASTAANAPSVSPATLLACKNATVFLEVLTTKGVGSGSGFFVEPQLIVTNAHVLGIGEEGVSVRKVTAALYSGRPGKTRRLDAQLVGFDTSSDIAFLRVDRPEDDPVEFPKPLSFAPGSSLAELMPVYALGYPWGNDLAVVDSSPAVTIHDGTVSSLRFDGGRLKVVQMNLNVNPGNSGGPIVNRNGEVVAVAVATIVGTTVSFAIPCDIVRNLLYGAIVDVHAAVTRESQDGFTMAVRATATDPHERLMEATLAYWYGPADTLQAKTEDGRRMHGDPEDGPLRHASLRRIDPEHYGIDLDVTLPGKATMWLFVEFVNHTGQSRAGAVPLEVLLGYRPTATGGSPSTAAVVAPLRPEKELPYVATAPGRGPSGGKIDIVETKPFVATLQGRVSELASAPSGRELYAIVQGTDSVLVTCEQIAEIHLHGYG